MRQAVGDWQFEVAGLVMGADTPYTVTDISGLRDRQPRSTYPNRPLGHGSMPLPDYLGSKQIILNLTLPSPDDPDILAPGRLETLLDELSLAWTPVLDGSTLKTFIYQLPGSPRKRLYGRARNFSVNMDTYDLGWVDAVVEFVATDPIAYSDTLSNQDIALATALGGRTYPRIYPMAYAGSVSNSTTIDNLGNANSYPVVTFNGPITNPSVENITTGQTVSFAIALAAGEQLIVDFAARTVLLNGTASRYNTMTSKADQWWALVPGGNAIRYAASTPEPGAVMNISWRSAWL